MQRRVDRGTPACLVMKPRRSSICIIWLTLGAVTRKCRSMSDSAGVLPKRWMYLEMKARYSSWRLVGRCEASCAADVLALSMRVRIPSGHASTIRTVASENWRISCCVPLTTACDTCRSFRRCVSDFESRCRACMMFPRHGWSAVESLSGAAPGQERWPLACSLVSFTENANCSSATNASTFPAIRNHSSCELSRKAWRASSPSSS